MKQLTLILLTLIFMAGCANLQKEPLSPTCQKIRRKMAVLKHTPGNGIPEEYYQLRQIYEEYDCP